MRSVRRLANRHRPGREARSALPPVHADDGKTPAPRVLILTAPVGEGHLAAARALSLSLAQTDAGAETHVCDVLPLLPRLLRHTLTDLYR